MTTETIAPGAYADINGVHLYHAVHGPAIGSAQARLQPLVILHGGLGSGDLLGPLVPAMAEGGRPVIAVDLQAHGRTPDVDRPIDPLVLAGDIAALIRHLGLERADVMGYSFGGAVALQVAAHHPEVVRRAVLVSVNATQESFFPEVRAAQAALGSAIADSMRQAPLYQHYQRVAPRPEDFGRLLDKMGEWIRSPFDYRADYASLRVPTLIACADADSASPHHFVELFESLGGGQRDAGWDGSGRLDGGHELAIIPGQTHYTVFESPLLAAAARTFLDR